MSHNAHRVIADALIDHAIDNAGMVGPDDDADAVIAGLRDAGYVVLLVADAEWCLGWARYRQQDTLQAIGMLGNIGKRASDFDEARVVVSRIEEAIRDDGPGCGRLGALPHRDDDPPR
jgi:hypothetical protein